MLLYALTLSLGLDNARLDISDANWGSMAPCPPKGEARTKAIKDRHCDYHPARFQFNGSGWIPCRVKRKGTASWRDMGEKPSFKLKDLDNGIDFGTWTSDRVTLNNMVQGTGAPAAYAVYRKVGVVAPQSRHVELTLYRNATRVRTDVYNLLETIDDAAFLQKHFGDSAVLWEVDNGEVKHERGDDALGPLTVANLTLETLDPSFPAFLAATEAVTHRDSIPYIDTNAYIAWTGSKFAVIPSGADQTFGCRNTLSTPSWVCAIVPSAHEHYYNCRADPEWRLPAAVACLGYPPCRLDYDRALAATGIVPTACAGWPPAVFVLLLAAAIGFAAILLWKASAMANTSA